MMRGIVDLRPVLPAYAGMIPRGRGPLRRRGRAPRVCGDDPGLGLDRLVLDSCSPRMRG